MSGERAGTLRVDGLRPGQGATDASYFGAITTSDSTVYDPPLKKIRVGAAGAGNITLGYAADTHPDTAATTLNVVIPATAAAQTITVAAAAGTFTRAAGNFLTDGFAPGFTFTPTGLTGNNLLQRVILTVTATVITVVDKSGLADEAGTGDETITAQAMFTRNAGSFLTDGFLAGQQVVSSGFTTGGNNTTRFIASVLSATQVAVTSNAGMAAEAGTGDERLVANTDVIAVANNAVVSGFLIRKVYATGTTATTLTGYR